MQVTRGALLSYRLYDVGDEIDLVRAAELANIPSRRVALANEGTGSTAQSLLFTSPPLVFALGKRTIAMPRTGRDATFNVTLRMFDYGAISVLFEEAIVPGTDLASLVPFCDELYVSDALDRSGRIEIDSLVKRIAPAIQGHHEWPEEETYTIVFVEELAGRPLAQEVLATPVLPRLLLGEQSARPLSKGEAETVLRRAFSYFEDDLTVVDWNSAFVLEPSGGRAIPDILEFATSQLLELRYYDGVFDVELARIYHHLDAARRESPWTLFSSPYRQLGREVVRRLVELTEFTERVDNALKIIGDPFLANVYEGAVLRFRIPSWRMSIDGKQALVAQAHALIRGELEVRRATVLELVIIVLIAIEVVPTLTKALLP